MPECMQAKPVSWKAQPSQDWPEAELDDIGSLARPSATVREQQSLRIALPMVFQEVVQHANRLVRHRDGICGFRRLQVAGFSCPVIGLCSGLNELAVEMEVHN